MRRARLGMAWVVIGMAACAGDTAPPAYRWERSNSGWWGLHPQGSHTRGNIDFEERLGGQIGVRTLGVPVGSEITVGDATLTVESLDGTLLLDLAPLVGALPIAALVEEAPDDEPAATAIPVTDDDGDAASAWLDAEHARLSSTR